MIETMKLTCLCDNMVTSKGLYGEHGLSYHLDFGMQQILFDTGQGLALRHNAAVLQIKLQQLSLIILSHGHYDHLGGLRSVLNKDKPRPVFAHPETFTRRYLQRKNDTPLYIGSPFSTSALQEWGAELNLDTKPREIFPGFYLSGPIKWPYPRENDETAGSMLKKADKELLPDDFVDEQALVIRSPVGLLIFTGCAHAGIANTIQQAREITGEERIHLLAGGLHLKNSSAEKIARAAEILQSNEIQKIAVSHCTGLKASAYLADVYGDNFHYLSAGSELSFDFQ